MKIVEQMLNNADLNYKRFNENIVKGDSPIIGVRIPELRKIAKYIVKNKQVDTFFKEYEGLYFEEKLIKGLLLASDENLFNQYVEDYLGELDSWCLVDTFCSSCKFINKHQDKYWIFVNNLLKRKEEFIVRCGYVFILNYYLSDKFIDEVINLLLKKYNFYYVNMAIAWCLCEVYISYPNIVEDILKKKILSEFVQNKSIEKINDSFRININDKVKLRDLKYF